MSYSGATYKYTVLDTSGRRSAAAGAHHSRVYASFIADRAVVGQLPQTAYHALLTPYSYFGLGRTNNYIENLFVGSTKHSPQHYINMEGVIPNSKVVIIPPLKDDEGWKRELYLRPGEWIPWVTLTVIATLGILAAIVIVLHLNEKVGTLRARARWLLTDIYLAEGRRAREETSITPYQLRRIIMYQYVRLPSDAWMLRGL